MPGPPPPPPAGGPPPPMMPAVSLGKGVPDTGALLQSIRKGTKLKKTVTVDKSGPMIPGKVSNVSANQNSHGGVSGSANSKPQSSVSQNGIALGGLFAGGMPKLKPTNNRLGITSNSNGSNNQSSSNTSSNSNQRNTDSSNQMPKNVNSIQSELKKQMANDSRNRGPPPPAPVRTNYVPEEAKEQKPNHVTKNGGALHHNSSAPQMNSSSMFRNSSTLHRKTSSNVSLSSDSVDTTATQNNYLPARPNHGKPNLAPKPPSLNGKASGPPMKLIIPKSISRAQSMKSPRISSPQSPEKNNTINYAASQGTVRNLSAVLNNSLAQSMTSLPQKSRPPLNGRPSAPPPSIPQQFTPPPPNKMVKPLHAPPPPPQHAPPPPPSRVAPSQPSRPPPAVPNAPPPPPRHSSIRDISVKKATQELESKFASMFHRVDEFPRPIPYRNCPKTYNSKQVVNKQQAPLPPNHVQLSNKLWDSSTC